ncbi:MAG: LacI family DNA-binding transcriptional regulator, partial [Lachnospiraceae bacterium]|nr:LacI family DNA-binding transcriptional regulator [Lachnospiraceae bacterium]
MKKKVAVFANGWSSEYLELVLEGLRTCAREENVDLFAFVNFSSGAEDKPDNIGEKSIFCLPDLKNFDGVVLATNTFNLVSEREMLAEAVRKTGIPAVTLEYELPDIPYLGTDNYKGFYELVEHVIQEHHAKDVLFISGPADNKESQIRLQATKDALQAADLKILDNHIIDAEWSYYLAYERLLEWLNSNKLPEVIICANDEMAIGVCTALEAKGIEVPAQVIVTGCDYSQRGQELYPIMTTVARKWDCLGYESLKLLLKRMTGADVPAKTVFEPELVIGESCGCSVDDARVARRLGAIREIYRKQRENNMNEWHLRYIDEMLARMRSMGDLKNEMKWNFEYNHTFEGSHFLICLVDDYFADDETRIINPGYFTKNMEVYVNLLDGKAIPSKVFPTRQLLPDYIEDK